MPIYITQGRYTRDAIKGMIVAEDRADAVARCRRPAACSATTSPSANTTSVIAEARRHADGRVLAGSGGGVTDLRTTVR